MAKNNPETVLGAIVSFTGLAIVLMCLTAFFAFVGIPKVLQAIRIEKIEAAIKQELAKTQHARSAKPTLLDVGNVVVRHPTCGDQRTITDILRELPEGTTLKLYPEVKIAVP